MKVRGAKLTAWIGEPGTRTHRTAAVDFAIKSGSMKPTSLPEWLIESMWFDRMIILNGPEEIRQPSGLSKALEIVRVKISGGIADAHPYSASDSSERCLRKGSKVELYAMIDGRRKCLLEGFVVKLESVVFL